MTLFRAGSQLPAFFIGLNPYKFFCSVILHTLVNLSDTPPLPSKYTIPAFIAGAIPKSLMSRVHSKQSKMKNVKFTGVNISAALLVLAYFFPWFSAAGTSSLSGFSITTNGISPGMLSMFLSGFDRILMILIIVVPLSGAVILYQNITGNKKFDKYYRPAHFIPAIVLLLGMILVYFKMKPDVPSGDDVYARAMRSASSMAPGLFDVLALGAYLSLAAAIYLVLVAVGKVKDKEYYTPATDTKPHTPGNDTPA